MNKLDVTRCCLICWWARGYRVLKFFARNESRQGSNRLVQGIFHRVGGRGWIPSLSFDSGPFKPAVPLVGKYRIVDIPISNCINSGLSKVYLLTQFNSASLHRHISQSYKFDHFTGGFVELLAAEQTLNSTSWYEGTADAVRKNIVHLGDDWDHCLILSGDQLYGMNFQNVLATHVGSNADLTVATMPVERDIASARHHAHR